MRIAVTGATGFVGHFIVAHLLATGHAVVALGRRRPPHAAAAFAPFDLDGAAPDLSGCDVLVHAALSHLPGRYRGGEGTDPDGFVRRNLDGTRRLFAAARETGVRRVLFLSSRAVYGAYPAGTSLHETLAPKPDTLYGRTKLAAERALADLGTSGLPVASLRATGVYGPPVPGLSHKWHDLLVAFGRGEPTEPRAATEVHALDLAEAVRLLATAPDRALEPGIFNLSDIILDRRELLETYARLTGISGPLPAAADTTEVSAMTTERLSALGWRPRGRAGLAPALRALAADIPVSPRS